MKKALIFLCLTKLLVASELLSPLQQNLLELDEKRVEQEGAINKKSWLNNLNINLSNSTDEDSDTTNTASISLSQDIYRFGGIYYAIEYAKALLSHDKLSVAIDKNNLLSTLFTTVYTIQDTQLEREQKTLELTNQKIKIETYKAQYKAGEVDISVLNEALMDKNTLEESLINLQTELKNSLETLKEYTKLRFSEINLPKLTLMNEEEFLSRSSALKQARLNSKTKHYAAKVTHTNYLPSLALTADYGYKNIENSSSDGEYYNYGVKLTMPLSFSANNEQQLSKIEALQADKAILENKEQLQIAYQQSLHNIASFQAQQKLALEDSKLYDELLALYQDEYAAGLKPLDDIQTLKNTKSIRLLDIKRNNISIEKEILVLYFKTL